MCRIVMKLLSRMEMECLTVADPDRDDAPIAGMHQGG